MEKVKVLHRELALQGSTGRREHDIIEVEEVHGVVATLKDEQGRVLLGLDEAEVDQVGDKATVPVPRRLFEAIQKAVKLTHHTQTSGVNEAGGLAAVHCLGQSAMMEAILDVQLVDRPIPREGKGEDGPNGGSLDDRTEGIVVVHSGVLSEALKDPTGFVAIQSTISLEFMMEDPLVGDHGSRGTRHQFPVVVGH